MVDQPSTATTPHSNLDTKTRLKSILGGSAVTLSNGTTGMYMPHLRSILLMHFSQKKSNRPTSSSCRYFCSGFPYASHWRMDHGDLF